MRMRIILTMLLVLTATFAQGSSNSESALTSIIIVQKVVAHDSTIVRMRIEPSAFV
jgi:hypothetical protein